MNNYVTGAAIRVLREKNHLTQQQLAEKLCVSDKAISKWETGKGFPDISLIEPLANVLQVSIPELLSGEQIINTNRSANILKSNLYVCPICGNIFHSTGSAMISCCGVTLPPIEAEQADEKHQVKCEKIEDEAGKEMITQGKISEITAKDLNMPLMSIPDYVAYIQMG